MLRVLRDFAVLMRASQGLGRASRLEARGEFGAAAAGYSDVLQRLDSLGVLPPNNSVFTIREASHFSIRVVVVTQLAGLAARGGDHSRARQLAREGLELCRRAPAPRSPASDWTNWVQWARSYLADHGNVS